MTAQLTHTAFDHPDGIQQTAFLLHGILGSRQNWRAFARRLVQRLPGWRLVTIDHRNHGDSPPLPGPHTVAACASDVAKLAHHLGSHPTVICGHSFGGKVALAYAQEHGAHLAQVWVLDASPAPIAHTPVDDHEVGRVMRALAQIPQPLSRRDQLVPMLTDRGFNASLARWMTTNLTRGPTGFTWRFDLANARAMIDDYFALDLWPVVDSPRIGPEVHVVQAERSDRWTPTTIDRLSHPPGGAPTHLHLLKDAGHWVHADNPDGLAELMVDAWAT